MKYYDLTGKRRTAQSNFLLGVVLAMIAGAINAGGFFLVMQYTSHMTGLISLAADSAALGEYFAAMELLGYIVCFILGATCTTLITLYAKRHHLHSQFTLPLLLEGIILTGFSLLWHFSNPHNDIITYFIATLSFIMGMQNALITKASSAIIRTTHITGMTTDLGIEIGRLLIKTKDYNATSTKDNIKRHITIICAFFAGGLLGAIGVNTVGVLTFIVIALILASLGIPQFARDLSIFTQRHRRKRKTHP